MGLMETNSENINNGNCSDDASEPNFIKSEVASIDWSTGRSQKKPPATFGSSQKQPLFARFLRWLYPDQRRTNRHAMPPLIAYLGTVRTSEVYVVGDVSMAGFYMLTQERWLPGSEMPVTLQRTDAEDLPATITLLSTVVRSSSDGVGFSFALTRLTAAQSADPRPGIWGLEDDLRKFLEGLNLAEYEPELEQAS
jgi:hypothetical protein